MIKDTYKVGTASTDLFYGNLKDFDTLSAYDNALWVFDENTKQYVPDYAKHCVQINSGEINKTWESIELILNKAIELQFGRDNTIIGLGGGVICDMAGFAASVYMRGCNLVLIPSTLLAMNDASLGGKTGIDYHGYKNLLGAFYPASRIYIFSDIVLSLSKRDYHSGLAEVIKHAFLDSNDFIKYLDDNKQEILNRDVTCLSEFIPRSLKIKGRIVENDANEHGIRAYLNLGHTFGHALETVSEFKILHGEAVAWGIGKAMEAGIHMGLTEPQYAETVKKLLADYQFSLSYPGYSPEDIIHSMQMDKKKRGGEVRFVLQENTAKTIITQIPQNILIKILSE